MTTGRTLECIELVFVTKPRMRLATNKPHWLRARGAKWVPEQGIRQTQMFHDISPCDSGPFAGLLRHASAVATANPGRVAGGCAFRPLLRGVTKNGRLAATIRAN